MAAEFFWESAITPLGHRLSVEMVDRGFILTVWQRDLSRDQHKQPAATWLIRSQVVAWWPTSLVEAARLVAHHCAFYDQGLQPLVPALLDKLNAIPEREITNPAVEPPKTPQSPPN